MAKSPVDRIAAMLDDEAPEKRIAAAIVLRELGARGPKVVAGLARMLDQEGPVQRHALEALAACGLGKALPRVIPLLSARDPAVRAAAIDAVGQEGAAAVPLVQAALEHAEGDARRALDTVLARLGGKEAFGTILAGLAIADAERARSAAVALRHEVKAADGRTRASYRKQLEDFLAREAGDSRRSTKARPRSNGTSPSEHAAHHASPAGIAAALKILGYLEDAKVVPTLLRFATDEKAHLEVRTESVIALRFALADATADTSVVDALVDIAERGNRTIAQAALMTLASVTLPPSADARLRKLVFHQDGERASFVLRQLASRHGSDATKLLVAALSHPDRRRADLAAEALEDRSDARQALVAALADGIDPEAAKRIRHVLKPMAKDLTAAQRKKLLEAAITKLEVEGRGFEASLDVARAAAPEKVADALRALAAKLRKGRKTDRAATALALLCRMEQASEADRYQLASLELGKSKKDTRPAARRGDDALRHLEQLTHTEFDVAKALRQDRSVGLEELFYVGFHFLEEEHPLGEELLGEVVKKGGRKKIATMAKNKLALSPPGA